MYAERSYYFEVKDLGLTVHFHLVHALTSLDVLKYNMLP